MKSIDERINALENSLTGEGYVAGTTLTRELMDTKLAKYSYNIVTDTTDQSILLWCLSLGKFYGHKDFYYGLTIDDCMTQAEDSLSLAKDATRQAAW